MKKWTDEQLQASVDSYLALRARSIRGEKVNKSQTYRELAQRYGKDPAAWARRFGNISQVMDDLGHSHIQGVKPLPNVGANVAKLLATMILIRVEQDGSELTDQYAESVSDNSKINYDPNDEFSPSSIEDQRLRVLRSSILRRGQPAFRRSLITAYGGRCAISGCRVLDVLEAAHVFPHFDGKTNDVRNGLLLRADLHTLFDLHLLSVEPETMQVAMSSKLIETEYVVHLGTRLAERAAGCAAISRPSLEWHRSRCDW